MKTINGGTKTIEELRTAWMLLFDCNLRIKEINEGVSLPGMTMPNSFNIDTHPELIVILERLETTLSEIKENVLLNKDENEIN